jgi:hypothetical protein
MTDTLENINERAKATLADLKKVVTATENCLEKTGGFPIYLGDINSLSLVLLMLAAKQATLREQEMVAKQKRTRRTNAKRKAG